MCDVIIKIIKFDVRTLFMEQLDGLNDFCFDSISFQWSFVHGWAVHGNVPHPTITGNSHEQFNDFIGDLI